LKRLLLISVVRVAAAVVVVWLGDYLLLRFRLPNHREQFGTVMVQREWIIPQKDRKNEISFDPPEPQTCVNSLFPHFDSQPCWYLRRHPTQQVNTGGAAPNY
jgi:hypothetical protein